MTTITKAFSSDMTIVDGSREMLVKITSDAIDREGEVLLPDGMDAKDFESNPIVFANHEYGVRDVVGRVTSLRRMRDHWLAKVHMLPRPDTHEGEWLADTILHLAKFGVMGVSVGFQPIESRKPTKKDTDLFGDAKRVYSKWKLVELSVAPIPANQEALILAVAKGMKRDDAVRFWPKVDFPVTGKDACMVRTVSLAGMVQRAWMADHRDRVNRKVADSVAQRVAMEVAKRRGAVYWRPG